METGIISFKDLIQIAISLSSLLLSITGFIFSIYIYKTVSLKSEFKKKQLETVLKLCDLLQETIIHLSAHGMDGTIGKTSSGTMFRFFQIGPYKKMFKGFLETQVFLVKGDPDRSFKFIEYCEHPYIPTRIALKIRKFVGYTYEPIELKEYKSFTILNGLGILELEEELFTITDNPVYNNLESFILACKDLDKEIHGWLKSIGIKEFNKKVIID